MKAVSLIKGIFENDLDNNSCGVCSFGQNVKEDAIAFFGEFNAAVLPKPGMSYFYQWIRVDFIPAFSEPDAFLLQGKENIPFAVYLWQIE